MFSKVVCIQKSGRSEFEWTWCNLKAGIVGIATFPSLQTFFSYFFSVVPMMLQSDPSCWIVWMPIDGFSSGSKLGFLLTQKRQHLGRGTWTELVCSSPLIQLVSTVEKNPWLVVVSFIFVMFTPRMGDDHDPSWLLIDHMFHSKRVAKKHHQQISWGLVYYNLRPNLVSWNTAVVSCPGHRWFMTLHLLREVVP